MEILTIQAINSTTIEGLTPSISKPDFNKVLRASALSSLEQQIKEDTQKAKEAHLEMLKSIEGES